MKKIIIIAFALLPFSAFAVPTPIVTPVVPVFPMVFWGTATIDSAQAPVGTIVRAYYGASTVSVGQVTVSATGIYGYDNPTKAQLLVGAGTGTIRFTFQAAGINSGAETEGLAQQTHSAFVSGGVVEKNLAFTFVPPVVPPPPPPPVSGGGGGGGGGGFSYTGDVRINNGAVQSSSTSVTLNLYSSGLSQMQISNTGTFSTTWLPFQSTYTWTLTAGTGTKTVYARFGNSSTTLASAQDTIELVGSGIVVPPPVLPPPGQVLGTSTMTCYLFTKTLALGSLGADVTALHTRLKADGLYTGGITAYFTPGTITAIKAFQTKHGLDPVGIVGPKTRAVLNACIPTQTPGNPGTVLGTSTYLFTKNLFLGSMGLDVTELQKRLTSEGFYSGPISGFFGPMTMGGVKAYQVKKNLEVVGIVGPKTRAALNSK